MDALWTLAILALICFVVVMLYCQHWMGIVGEMQFARLPEHNRSISSQHFWRFIFISVLVFLFFNCSEIVVSVFDPHYPVYLSPRNVVCVLLVNLLGGLSFGFFFWLVAAVGVPLGAFWPLSEDEKRAGRKLFWRRRRYTHLSLDEKIHLKKISSLRGLFLSLINGYLSLLLALAFFLFFGGLGTSAMQTGFPSVPKEKPHVNSAVHPVSGNEILEVLFLVATALGFLPWLLAKIRAWRVFRKDSFIAKSASPNAEA